MRESSFKLQENLLLDMDEYSSKEVDLPTSSKFEEESSRFQQMLDEQVCASTSSPGAEPNYYVILLKVLLRLFYKEILLASSVAAVAECMLVYYAFYTQILFAHLKQADAPLSEGLQILLIFCSCQFVSIVARQYYIFVGYRLTIKLRRVLSTALYDKTARLSLHGMGKTNSGKMISLISADFYTIERGLCLSPLLVAAPVINLLVVYLLQSMFPWLYVLVFYLGWGLLMLLQFLTTDFSKNQKRIESGHNDERLKIVSDLIAGCRTVKCYGWEGLFHDKISAVRARQMAQLIKINFTLSLGNSFFPVLGLGVLIFVLVSEWRAGNELEQEKLLSLLCLINVVYITLNSSTYLGLTKFQDFLATIRRISSVLELEEQTQHRQRGA